MNNGAPALSIQKEFNASKEKLYKAWTEEDSLKKWWKPMNKTLVSAENDIRPGGKVVYAFEGDLKIHGEYTEAQPAAKLVYSWIWDVPEASVHGGEYKLTINFGGEGEKSSLSVLQEAFQNEQSVQPHREGWEQALEELKRFVESA